MQDSSRLVHYWKMKDGDLQSEDHIFISLFSGWDVIDVGDVDLDGTDDIVLQKTDGRVRYWKMYMGERQTGINIYNPATANWEDGWTLGSVGDIE